MKINGNFINTSFRFSGHIPESLRGLADDGELFNCPDLLFLEEEYMNSCDRFSKIVDKFKIKKFNSNLSLYTNNEIKKIDDFSKEVELYHKIIDENNINGLQKNDLMISVSHFEKYEKSPKVKSIQSIYILLFLSSMTEYCDNKFNFKIKISDKEFEQQIVFSETNNFDLFPIYSWIISSKENVQTRLRIVRELIVRKKNFDLINKDLDSAKSAFNRIIAEETDDYFTQVNILKDDFMKLSERQRKSYQSLHLKFLGWGTSIALFIYGELKNQPSKNLWKRIFFSGTEKSYLFLVIFLISLLTIWILFKKEMNQNKKDYSKIKDFYTKQLFFESEDFSSFVDAPEISKLYTIIFYIILGLLLIRIFLLSFTSI
ncbi:hypothetical protein [Leuconostoc mesenteroides]|uniref:hypothetical protein n=1 Tax=Leuconostoc mesenteroides TaxID=1245 RepID=UPI0032DFA5B4